MKCITLSALKGGVGKSSLAILIAETLHVRGKRVLVIDMDIQNSVTFYYSPSEEMVEKRNIAQALMGNSILDNIITIEDRLALIPSSFNLVKLRSIPLNSLKRIIHQIEEEYDYCIIDAAPTLDNLVLNAVMVSDLIITPVRLTQFDWKSAHFYKEQIFLETGKTDNWRILMNFWKEPRSSNPLTDMNQYIDLFRSDFDESILETVIPETVHLQKTIDSKLILGASERRKTLTKAISLLTDEIVSELNSKSVLQGFGRAKNG